MLRPSKVNYLLQYDPNSPLARKHCTWKVCQFETKHRKIVKSSPTEALDPQRATQLANVLCNHQLRSCNCWTRQPLAYSRRLFLLRLLRAGPGRQRGRRGHEYEYLQNAAEMPPNWWIFFISAETGTAAVLDGQAHSFFMTEKAFCQTAEDLTQTYRLHLRMGTSAGFPSDALSRSNGVRGSNRSIHIDGSGPGCSVEISQTLIFTESKETYIFVIVFSSGI